MKRMLVIVALVFGLVPSVFAANYSYVSADKLKGWLEAGKSVELVDIQEAKDFAQHHIKGSVETNGYPVKSTEDKQRLEIALQKSQEQNYEAIVVVCPRGKGGAKRTYDYLASKGVPVEKLYILTGGMQKWPYAEWVSKK